MKTAVEYLLHMYALQGVIYQYDIDKAIEMEKEQLKKSYEKGKKYKKPLKDSNPIYKILTKQQEQ
jgi:hypothetical protein